jgi:hypothetical protein
MGLPWDNQMRGMDFNAKQEARMIRILCKTLNQQHSEALVEKVDFDLLAVFLMQEMHWNIHIQQLVNMVLDQFGPKAHPLGERLPEPEDDNKKPFAPRTPLQSQIHHAALHVNKTINQYTQELQTNPNARQTFCSDIQLTRSLWSTPLAWRKSVSFCQRTKWLCCWTRLADVWGWLFRQIILKKMGYSYHPQ